MTTSKHFSARSYPARLGGGVLISAKTLQGKAYILDRFGETACIGRRVCYRVKVEDLHNEMVHLNHVMTYGRRLVAEPMYPQS